VSNQSDKPPNERRAWRTDQEWARLRERITAGDVAAPAVARSWLEGRTRWIVAAAAVLVVAAGVSWRVRKQFPPAAVAPVAATSAERVATTGVGERLAIHLADSSVVTLGPMSTVRYGERSVALVDGMADFNVVHDTTRPFRVLVKNTVVTDVGTEFVVRAYAADSGVQVSVTSGIVAVSGGAAGDASDSMELRSGQVAFVNANGRPAKVTGASAQSLAAWMDGRIEFDNVPLGAVAVELERWLDVQIRIPDRQLAQRRLSAGYSRPTVSGVFDAIAATLSLRYQRRGNVVTLLPAEP
jgi:transmembrane sensor